MAKKSAKKRDVERDRQPAGKGGGKARRKAEKRAEELAAALVKVRKKAQARIEKAQQAIRKAEKRAEKARAAADGSAGQRGVLEGTQPSTIPFPPQLGDAPVGVPAPGPDYAVPVPDDEKRGPTILDVSVPEAVSPGDGGSESSAEPSAERTNAADAEVPEAVTTDSGTSPGGEVAPGAPPAGTTPASGNGQSGGSAPDLTPPLPTEAADDEPNAGWTLVRLRTMAKERGVPGYSSKSKSELLDALKD